MPDVDLQKAEAQLVRILVDCRRERRDLTSGEIKERLGIGDGECEKLIARLRNSGVIASCTRELGGNGMKVRPAKSVLDLQPPLGHPQSPVTEVPLKAPLRGTCFVIMPFSSQFKRVYESALKPAVESCGLRCLRGDETVQAGAVVDHIRRDIGRCCVCVADLTGNNPNVYAEVGLAIGADKPVILISQDDLRNLPFDVQHFRVFQYQTSDLSKLQDLIVQSVKATLGSHGPPLRLLRQLLVPSSLGEQRQRFVIASSPLSYRESRRTESGYTHLQPTSGDLTGVRALIQAFGSVFGLNYLPDLLNPNDFIDAAAYDATTPTNLYCVGSPKANRWTGLMLKKLHELWRPRLGFQADPASEDLRNVAVASTIDGQIYRPTGFEERSPQERDFGFIIRAPHPCYPAKMLLIIAGRSALGTEAASLAVTEPAQIQRIKKLLAYRVSGVNLDDHQKAFWAVAQMAKQCNSMPAGNEQRPVVVDAGPLQPNELA